MSQKEKYLYDRREWSKSGIIITIIGGVFLMLLFDHLGGGKRLNIVVAVLLFFCFIYHFSLRVTITDEKMIFHEGFFPILRRTIFFDEVVDIAFKNVKKYDHLVRGGKQFLNTGGLLDNNPKIILKLRNNSAFGIAGSDDFMQEILAVIRKKQSHITID